MSQWDQKVSVLGGPFLIALFGAGLLIAGFVPPPSPTLGAEEVAALYRDNSVSIRLGMVMGLTGMTGFVALVCAISVQMRRMRTSSRLSVYLQLGAGSIGVLTVMFPVMIFAVTAFRPERDAALTQLLNDTGWLFIISAYPTFVAQFLAIAFGVLQDRSAKPVFPRWCAYFNVWIAVLFTPGALSYFLRTGPFAWDGLIAFWVAGGAFFVWLIVMTWLMLGAIDDGARGSDASAP